MGKIKVAFQFNKEATEILEEAKWILRKSKNQILEDLILTHLKPVVFKKRKRR